MAAALSLEFHMSSSYCSLRDESVDEPDIESSPDLVFYVQLKFYLLEL